MPMSLWACLCVYVQSQLLMPVFEPVFVCVKALCMLRFFLCTFYVPAYVCMCTVHTCTHLCVWVCDWLRLCVRYKSDPRVCDNPLCVVTNLWELSSDEWLMDTPTTSWPHTHSYTSHTHTPFIHFSSITWIIVSIHTNLPPLTHTLCSHINTTTNALKHTHQGHTKSKTLLIVPPDPIAAPRPEPIRAGLGWPVDVSLVTVYQCLCVLVWGSLWAHRELSVMINCFHLCVDFIFLCKKILRK